jgi:hypothetical protein
MPVSLDRHDVNALVGIAVILKMLSAAEVRGRFLK